MGDDSLASKPMFIGFSEFEGSSLAMELWRGGERFSFQTNFPGIYPLNPRRLKKMPGAARIMKNDLEARLKNIGLKNRDDPDVKKGEFNIYLPDPKRSVYQFYIDRSDFAKFPEQLRNLFVTNYMQSFRWQYGYLPKVRLDSWLEELLTEKNEIDRLLKESNSSLVKSEQKSRSDALRQLKAFVRKEYMSPGFDNQLIAMALSQIGYRIKNESLDDVFRVFNSTPYSLDTPIHFLRTQMAAIGVEKLPEYPEMPDRIMDEKEKDNSRKFYAGEIGKSFGTRFFLNSALAFGEQGLRGISATAPDYIAREEQEHILQRLKELLRAKPKYLFDPSHSKHIRGQISELFEKIIMHNAEKAARHRMARELGGRDGGVDDENRARLREAAERKKKLEEKLCSIGVGSSLKLDLDKRRIMMRLDIMHRSFNGMPYFNGMTADNTLTATELVYKTRMMLYDIEKFQYGSIKEVLSACASIVRTEDDMLHSQLDLLRRPSKRRVKGFIVKVHNTSADLAYSVAEFANLKGVFLHINYGSYDLREMRATRDFRIGRAKEIMPRRRVSVDFVDRCEVPGAFINLLNLMKTTRPQLPNHKLSEIVNYLGERAGLDIKFAKSFTHEELRRTDRAIEDDMESKIGAVRKRAQKMADSLADYTVDDVKVLMQAMLAPGNIDIFLDLFDVCSAFGVSLDQASTNANTVTNIVEKSYFERFGSFLDRGIFRKQYLKHHDRLINHYSRIQTISLAENRMPVSFKRGIIRDAARYYFSPELLIAKSFAGTFSSLGVYIDKTISLYDDPDRVIARLQFLKPFVMNVLAEMSMVEAMHQESAKLEAMVDELEQFTSDSEKKKRQENLKRKKAIAMPLTAEQIRKKQGKLKETIRRREVVFSRMFGLGVLELKERIKEAYARAAQLMATEKINPFQLKQSFLYGSDSCSSRKRLLEGGLVKLETGLTVYSMGRNNLTYKKNEKFIGYPAKLERPSYRASILEQKTKNRILECVFAGNPEGAIAEAKKVYVQMNRLEQMISNPTVKATDLFQEMLFYHRKNNRYFGVVALKPDVDKKGKPIMKPVIRRYTPDERMAFRPDLRYYKERLMREFLGLGAKGVDIHAVVPTLLGGIIDMGDDNLPETIKRTKAARRDYRLQFIPEEELPLFRMN